MQMVPTHSEINSTHVGDYIRKSKERDVYVRSCSESAGEDVGTIRMKLSKKENLSAPKRTPCQYVAVVLLGGGGVHKGLV